MFSSSIDTMTSDESIDSPLVSTHELEDQNPTKGSFLILTQAFELQCLVILLLILAIRICNFLCPYCFLFVLYLYFVHVLILSI